MKSKLASIPISIILTIFLTIFLSWNEGNYLNEKIKLKNIEEATTINSKEINTDNENKLVLLSDEIKSPGVLEDEQFGIKLADAVNLERKVFTYQWVESSSKDKDKKITYSYRKEWSESLVDSTSFNRPSTHENPRSKMFESKRFLNNNITLGSFSIGTEYVNQMSRTKTLDLSKISYNNSTSNSQIINGELFIGSNPSSPEIGDTKIIYEYVPTDVVTVVGQQFKSTIKPFKTDRGDLAELAYGELDKDEMLSLKQKENKQMTWIFRLGGLIGLWISALMFFSPLTSLSDRIPMVGNIVGFGVGIVSFTISLVWGLGVISISWLAFRPLISIGLIAIIVILVINLIRVKRKKQRFRYN